MKLKEKLCKEWVEKVYFGQGADHHDAFLAGFEKVREILSAKWTNHCQFNACHCDCFVDDCETLGEEEVE